MMSGVIFLLLIGMSGWVTLRGAQQRFGPLAGRRWDLPTDHLGARLWRMVSEVVMQKRILATRPIVGLLHALVMWGFVAFTGVSIRHLWMGIAGSAYTPDLSRWYRDFVAVWAVAVLIGIGGLAFRRFVLRPRALGPVSPSSGLVTLLIVTLMATYLMDHSGQSPILWWMHTLALLAFPPVIVRSKHLHLVLAPITIFFGDPAPRSLRPLQLDADGVPQELGLTEAKEVSFGEMLRVHTCVECGRCDDFCPAHRSGGTLSPKYVMLQTKHGIIDEHSTDQCLTCGGCTEVCPVGVDPLGLISELKRGVINNGIIGNKKTIEVFKKLEKEPHNGWNQPTSIRTAFVTDQKFPLFEKGMDVLFWLGCGNSYDPHGQQVALAMQKLFIASGVSWGVLKDEPCCGEVARRMGNEMLFLQLSATLIQTLAEHAPSTIVTCCPHCSTMFKRDYQQFADYRVLNITTLHHTEFLQSIRSLLNLRSAEMTVTYHDPCNLARQQGIIAAPREMLRSVGATIREPAESGLRTSCCGAGGGQIFIGDEGTEKAKRINQQRYAQLEATGATTIVVACAYCHIMQSDVADAHTTKRSMRVRDIAEVLAEQLVKKEVTS